MTHALCIMLVLHSLTYEYFIDNSSFYLSSILTGTPLVSTPQNKKILMQGNQQDTKENENFNGAMASGAPENGWQKPLDSGFCQNDDKLVISATPSFMDRKSCMWREGTPTEMSDVRRAQPSRGRAVLGISVRGRRDGVIWLGSSLRLPPTSHNDSELFMEALDKFIRDLSRPLVPGAALPRLG